MRCIKYLCVIIAITSLIVLISCGNGSIHADKDKNLYAIEVSEGFFTPQDGITIQEAKELIVDELEITGVKGDIEKAAIIEEITIQEFWDNMNVQLFRVDVDYAWINGVAMIKDRKVLKILSGMPTEGVFIADLDIDGFYEVYTNVLMGSGIVSKEILGFNMISQETYHLAMRGKSDFTLFIENHTLMANISTYPDTNQIEKTGKVLLNSENDVKKLYVE